MNAAQHAHADAPARRPAIASEDAMLRMMAAADCDLLAMLHADELSGPIIERLRKLPLSAYLGLRPNGATSRAALEELEAAAARLPRVDDVEGIEQLAAEYADVYLRYSYRASPGESVWRDPDRLERQEPMFKVRNWFRRSGYLAADGQGRTEDHIVRELRFTAWALDPCRGALPMADIGRFLDEHPLTWIAAFATRLDQMRAHPFYVALALYTATALDDIRTHIEGVTGMPRALLPVSVETQPLQSVDDARYVPGMAPGW